MNPSVEIESVSIDFCPREYLDEGEEGFYIVQVVLPSGGTEHADRYVPWLHEGDSFARTFFGACWVAIACQIWLEAHHSRSAVRRCGVCGEACVDVLTGSHPWQWLDEGFYCPRETCFAVYNPDGTPYQYQYPDGTPWGDA
jgi:hypothetical protein